MSSTLPELSYKVDAMQHSIKKKPLFLDYVNTGCTPPIGILPVKPSVRCR